MISQSFLLAFATLLWTASVYAQGLYSKGSVVLQVDGKNYNKLVAKSNQVSVRHQNPCAASGLTACLDSRVSGALVFI